jgi:hypothetical protein
MSSVLAGLGASLVNAYQLQLDEWPALDISVDAHDLQPSLNLADDILRFEAEWQSCLLIAPALQADFIPQDLFTPTELIDSAPVPVAFQQKPALHKAEGELRYPFQAAGENTFSTVEAESTTQFSNALFTNSAVENILGMQAAPITERTLHENTFADDEDAFTQLATQRIPVVDNLLADEVVTSSPLDPLFKAAAKPTRPGDLIAATTKERIIAPAANPLQQESLMTNIGGEQESADSIWGQQLRNLGDFASVITSVSSKRESPALPQHAPVPQALADHSGANNISDATAGFAGKPATWRPIMPEQHPNVPPAAVYPAYSNSNNSNAAQPAFVMAQATPHLPEGTLFPLPDSLQSQAIDPVQPVFVMAQATPHLSESTLFPLPDSLQSQAIDPDELLQTLTERIVRDFRRYYP